MMRLDGDSQSVNQVLQIDGSPSKSLKVVVGTTGTEHNKKNYSFINLICCTFTFGQLERVGELFVT